MEKPRNYRNVLLISLSQFGIGFSFNFVMVFLPFYVHGVSPYSFEETLIWVGLIMGSTSIVAAIASTFWGSLTARFSPKALYLKGLLSHAVLILLMGFVTSLPWLLALRLFQGVLGGISTVGLVIVTSSTTRESAVRDIAFFQNTMTLGQLVGPPLGALAASMLGYKGAFVSASLVVFVTLAFCYFNVVDIPTEPRQAGTPERNRLDRRAFIGWGLCFTATVQLMFLPSILPNVFDAFHIGHEVALRWSGLVVMAYICTAMLGTYLLCRIASRVGTRRLILVTGVLGVAFQALLCLSPGILDFVGIRMAQTAMIAPALPLVISLFASDLKGKVLGFLNSGRFAGNALGPMISTWVLAYWSLNGVYLFVGGLSLLALLWFAYGFASRNAPR
ncbi:MAG: MFS transporter [Thermodesulfobacteriota bacterium]